MSRDAPEKTRGAGYAELMEAIEANPLHCGCILPLHSLSPWIQCLSSQALSLHPPFASRFGTCLDVLVTFLQVQPKQSTGARGLPAAHLADTSLVT